MNQFDIEAQIDQRLTETEAQLEKRLRSAQKTILNQLAAMYAKYEREGALTYQEMQKYNRLEKELARITETLTAEYQQVVADVQAMQENHYLLKFLLTAYLLDQFIARPSLPSTEVISAVFIFITGALKLPRLGSGEESDAVKAVEKAFKRGIADNESKDDLIKRIEKVLPSTVKESAPQLAESLIDRIETPVNVIGIKQPSPVEVRKAVKAEDAKLSPSRTFTKHRNKLASGIREEITAGLQKGESYAQLAKRLERQFDMASNKARLVARTESGRVRSIASEAVFQQAAEHSSATKVWMSALDTRVRKTHQKLDAVEANRNGVFKSGINVAVAPRLFIGPNAASLNINCRCTTLLKVDGKIPDVRRGRDYRNDKYQQKLADRIDKMMADEALTYKQALKKANKEILPPSTVIPFKNYADWLKEFSG